MSDRWEFIPTEPTEGLAQAVAQRIPCPREWPHFYVSAIVGGEPGPVPSVCCVCPGVTAGSE